ncbi:2-(3-amino-3-carboxypropyl)histidine synthase subunit 2 isoform X2 [Ambystoma mexicanum]|uniref:2-(3-amino-3-carboxypropyl)histidine synthase subunit 2 isoform X2 n=1 Tax=Ambystoma mexicanum TaxID=8296 RepID=UPI0037E8A31E
MWIDLNAPGATCVTMAMQFSSDSTEAMKQTPVVNDPGGRMLPDEMDEVYEIKRTADFIQQCQSKRVALQFPDELLVNSAEVAAKLEEITGSKTFILGDTSYGSCCVDEVAAEHVLADSLVHYGRSCLSPSTRLPVLFVFGRRLVDINDCAAAFRTLYPDQKSHVVVVCDVVYSYIMGDLKRVLRPEYPHVSFSNIDNERHPLSSGKASLFPLWTNDSTEHPGAETVKKFGRQFSFDHQLGLEGYGMFYIGEESLTLTNLMMTWNKCAFCTFNPVTRQGRHETLSISRALMKRYYLIERARDAKVVGILVGTLGVADYLSVIEHIKATVRKAGKKSYTFVMGKLNVAKLANFLEVDIYVLVACPENSLLDSSEFYRPVITPFEMDMAYNRARQWTGDYITDYRDLLPGSCSHVEFPDEDPSDAERTDISLITGELRSVHLTRTQDDGPSCTAVEQRNSALTVAELSPAASFLDSRSWKGLEQKLGETAVTKARQGRRGIAIAYDDEVNS